MSLRLRWGASAFAVLGALAHAQPAPLDRANAAAIPRFALVVGVENYTQHGRVPNAINDAQTVAMALERGRQFTHIRTLLDPESSQDIVLAIDEIVQRAGDAATIVFYYAGHGFQFDGANYIVPRLAGKPVRNPQTRQTDKEPLVRASLSIAALTDRMRARDAGANILFIDACREHILGVHAFNPKDEPKGFLHLTNPLGALVSFSTGFGDTAESHTRRTPSNSPYAAALSQYLDRPAMVLNPMMLATLQSLVSQATGRQRPEPLNPIGAGTFFYFHPTQSERDAEAAMWRKAKDSKRRNCIRDFLTHYRDGVWVRHAAEYLKHHHHEADPTEAECTLL